MFSIILRTLKDRKISFLVYTIAAVVFIWMYVAIFPTFQNQADELQGLVEAYPPELLAAFGVEGDNFGLDTIENFLALENYSFIWPIMMIFLVVGFAGWAIASGIEKGTIEHMLAKPISRTKIFFGRYFAGIAMLLIFTFLSVYAAIPFSELHDVDYIGEAYWYMFLLSLLFGWAVFSIGMLVSVVFSEKSRALMTVGGMILLMYVANIVSNLVEKFEELQYVSFFYYYDHTAALIDHTISAETIFVFTITAVVFTIGGWFWFNKRDIAT